MPVDRLVVLTAGQSIGRASRPSCYPPCLDPDEPKKKKKRPRGKSRPRGHPWLNLSDMDAALERAEAADVPVSVYLAQQVQERVNAVVNQG